MPRKGKPIDVSDPVSIAIDGALNERQEKFAQLYADPDHEHWHSANTCVKLAGFGKGNSMGNRLLANPKVRQRIFDLSREHAAWVCQSPSTVLLGLERVRIMAEAKGDLSTATRCLELVGKSMAIFTERSVVMRDNDDISGLRGQMTAREHSECQRIAAVMLALPGGDDGGDNGRMMP